MDKWPPRLIAQKLLDLLFPPRCPACKRSGQILCPTCLATIQPIPAPFCTRCSAPLSPQGQCPQCSYHRPAMSGLRVASVYQGALRSSIHALKYQGNRRLAAPLGALLAQAYTSYGMQADLLVPVPLHTDREKERGYNQAQLLALECAQHLTLPLNTQLVARTRPTLVQAHLTASERQQNVSGAFACPAGDATQRLLARKVIVIIDDVCTTGATLEACAAPLFAAGARAVWGLVLAHPFNS